MPKYHVLVREVYVARMEIEAQQAAEALRLVQEGEGDLVNTEYSHTLDQETWSIEEQD